MDAPVTLPAAHAPRAVPVGNAFAWYEEAMRLFKRAPAMWCVLGFITVASELLLNFIPGLGVALAKVVVPVGNAFAWYEEAMRLFKRAPAMWCLLGFITVASELLLNFIPGFGVALAKVVVPVIECGMLLGAAAVDRGEPLQARLAFATFGARPAAIAAIVVSALLIFGVEAWTAYAVAGINLLENADGEASMTMGALCAVFATGTLASLPLTFVPFAALFEGATFTRAFAASTRGFARNVVPLLVFGGLALVLVLIGLLSYGFGLIAIFPLVAAASYAAWKDIYAVAAPPGG